MRKWKRRLFGVVAAVLLAGVALVAWPRPGRITRVAFDRIRPGMSRAEVEALLGSPGDYRTGVGETVNLIPFSGPWITRSLVDGDGDSPADPRSVFVWGSFLGYYPDRGMWV